MGIATNTETANQIVSQVEKSKNCNTSDGRRNFRKNFSFAVRDDAENERVTTTTATTATTTTIACTLTSAKLGKSK